MAPETDHRQLTLPLLGPSLTLGSPENDSAGRLPDPALHGA